MNDLPRDKLKELLAQHGRTLCQDLRRCEALLRDYCGEFRREVFVLVSALREEIPADLMTVGDNTSHGAAWKRLAQRLHDNLGIAEDAAYWAVESWARALGMEAPEEPLAATAGAAPALTIDRELVVAPTRPGCYRTITEALRAASPGTRVLVQPGYYREELVLEQSVEIVGQGSREEVSIVSTKGSCVRVRTDRVRLQGLTLCLQIEKGQAPRVAVEVRQGHIDIDDCDITSNSLSCVLVHGGKSRAWLRRCHIHRSAECGVFVVEQASARLEDCDIERNVLSGVHLIEGELLMQRCEVHDQMTNYGVHILDNGQAVIEECSIYSNGLTGVAVSRGGRPVIRGSKIFDGREAGILLHERGQGTIEDCEIFDNATAGIIVRDGSTPTIRKCRIHDQQNHFGVYLCDGGQGVIEQCEIFANRFAGVGVRQDGRAIVRSCQIHHHARHNGVSIYERGQATISDCAIFDNSFAGVELRQGSRADIRNSRIRGNGTVAIRACQDSRGLVEGCDLSDNTISAWNCDQDCRVVAQDNKE